MSSSFFIDRANLAIVRELGDRAAQGRACGNLGNTHYLLGNFETAIQFHTEVSKGGGEEKVEKEEEEEALEKFNLRRAFDIQVNMSSRGAPTPAKWPQKLQHFSQIILTLIMHCSLISLSISVSLPPSLLFFFPFSLSLLFFPSFSLSLFLCLSLCFSLHISILCLYFLLSLFLPSLSFSSSLLSSFSSSLLLSSSLFTCPLYSSSFPAVYVCLFLFPFCI